LDAIYLLLNRTQGTSKKNTNTDFTDKHTDRHTDKLSSAAFTQSTDSTDQSG